jgi:hypothetical protein
MKVSDTDMDDCSRCKGGIISDTDKQWIVANVYVECCLLDNNCKTCRGTGRKWDRLEHWHVGCYAAGGHPYGKAEVVKTKKKVERTLLGDDDW